MHAADFLCNGRPLTYRIATKCYLCKIVSHWLSTTVVVAMHHKCLGPLGHCRGGGALPGWGSIGVQSQLLRGALLIISLVKMLQEVYGKLEEPDGLGGLLRLRQGPPRLQDQLLAAEKAGSWSEALALHEQVTNSPHHTSNSTHSTHHSNKWQ